MLKILALFSILLVLAVSGCTAFDKPANNAPVIQTTVPTPTPTATVREPQIVHVKIWGSAFEPLELRVVRNTTVNWTNSDSSQHVIFVDNNRSTPFNRRESWSYSFNKTGTFEYGCLAHPWMKHGRIIVE